MYSFEKEKSIAFSGHRPYALPQKEQELFAMRTDLHNIVCDAINAGARYFLQGGCYGFDLLCAKVILDRRSEYRPGDPDIKLVTVAPFRDQSSRWSREYVEMYNYIIEMSDEIIYTAQEYSSGVYHLRDRFLVDHSAMLVAYCNALRGGTYYTVNYALERGVPVYNIATKKFILS